MSVWGTWGIFGTRVVVEVHVETPADGIPHGETHEVRHRHRACTERQAPVNVRGQIDRFI